MSSSPFPRLSRHFSVIKIFRLSSNNASLPSFLPRYYEEKYKRSNLLFNISFLHHFRLLYSFFAPVHFSLVLPTILSPLACAVQKLLSLQQSQVISLSFSRCLSSYLLLLFFVFLSNRYSKKSCRYH